MRVELLLRSPEKMDRLDALLSATCLGHLARIHKQLDIELVLSRLVPLKNDPSVGSGVQDARDDIRFFLKFQ